MKTKKEIEKYIKYIEYNNNIDNIKKKKWQGWTDDEHIKSMYHLQALKWVIDNNIKANNKGIII